MTNQILIYRLEDLSMIHFIETMFQDYAFITVVDEFPKVVLETPTISVVNGKLKEEQFELGNEDFGVRTRRWFIDIFAKNKSQRDDFAYKILDESDSGISVYDYNEGFPPDASPTVINHLSVISKVYQPLSVIPQSNEKLYYRGQLILITKNDKV